MLPNVPRRTFLSNSAGYETTVWRYIFEAHNFRGFRGLALVREN